MNLLTCLLRPGRTDAGVHGTGGLSISEATAFAQKMRHGRWGKCEICTVTLRALGENCTG